MTIRNETPSGRFTITAKVMGEEKSFSVHEMNLFANSLMFLLSERFPEIPMSEIYLISVLPAVKEEV